MTLARLTVARRQNGALITQNTRRPAGVLLWYDVHMQWSTTRQLLFALGALVLVGAVSAGSYFFFFYKPPSCLDGLHNQDEEGVDCGGACAKLCVQPNVSALWARSVRVAPGVYHAVALIKNPDTASRGTISYSVSLFDSENILIARREGAMELSPGDIAPLFEANIVAGERVPMRTFVDIGNGSFERFERATLPIRVLSFALDDEGASRLTAQIENESALPASGISVTALLFDKDGILVNASKTRIDRLEARERRAVVFTWQEPFAETPERIDIIPRLEAQ